MILVKLYDFIGRFQILKRAQELGLV